MFLTAEEAQRRWCPFGHQPMHVAQHGYMVGNRQPNGDVPSCLGPLCMAWRWATPKSVRELDMVSGEVLDEQPRRGYCGLSGPVEHGD